MPLEAVFSNITIDLRNENLEGKTLHIHITAIFGQIKILLPKGGYIQKNIQSILGNFKNRQKNKSLVKRIINLGKSSKQVESNFKVKITGNLWVSNMKVIQ